MEYKKLIETAIMMLRFSYAPYSHFHVGASLLCQIENSSENLDSSESKNKSTSSNTTIHGRTNNIDRELSRTGNIGNITQQELIKQERDIVQYIIWDTIYDDLNRVFTRSKYIY